MLPAGKKSKMVSALKDYKKKFLNSKVVDLDESGTRLMINSFLTDILCYLSLEEVKTEYMIKGTYADYVVQLKGVRHFLVEVKALSLSLSDKHLRQAINYGANEGIEWALLTNGRHFELYKILFQKPIDSKLVLSVDLSSDINPKKIIEHLQFLHKDAVNKKGLTLLWNKHEALDPTTLAGLLYSKPVTNFIKKEIKKKFKTKVDDAEITTAVNSLVTQAINLDDVKHFRTKSSKKIPKTKELTVGSSLQNPSQGG